MVLYVILCMYSFGVFYSFEITPNIIESILEFLLVAIELVLFLYYLIQYGLVMKVRKISKENEQKSSYASSSSSGFGDYSSNDCSSSSDGGGDCGGGGD